MRIASFAFPLTLVLASASLALAQPAPANTAPSDQGGAHGHQMSYVHQSPGSGDATAQQSTTCHQKCDSLQPPGDCTTQNPFCSSAALAGSFKAKQCYDKCMAAK